MLHFICNCINQVWATGGPQTLCAPQVTYVQLTNEDHPKLKNYFYTLKTIRVFFK